MKSQSSMEFIIVLGIVSIIFLIGFNSLAVEFRGVNQYMWSNQARDLAEKLASEINNMYVSGENSSTTVTMPARLYGGVDYSILVYRGLVSINVTTYDREFSWRTVTRNINGSDSGLALTPGEIKIENIGGTIYLT
jgi:hypothetical protein